MNQKAFFRFPNRTLTLWMGFYYVNYSRNRNGSYGSNGTIIRLYSDITLKSFNLLGKFPDGIKEARNKLISHNKINHNKSVNNMGMSV
ncbi:hypothetical protein RIR_jg31646.t1 [Rhizophagus irregularis DAOM 181602=DAOM 197198]|nr:hypothetical protein RIR_jg31646.t1 [Rhizophagus irregularis DAOM 181602=DAOM 197198]